MARKTPFTNLPVLYAEEEGDSRTETQMSASATPELAGLGKRDYATLVTVSGPDTGKVVRLDRPEITLGRGTTCDVRLVEEGISRTHARLVRRAGAILVEDMGSANGTFVNGERVRSRVLGDGDKIGIGPATILRFTLQDKVDEAFYRKMYETVLRDGLYRALFTSNPTPTFVVGAAPSSILAVNAAAIALYGHGEPDFLRLSLADLWAPGAALGVDPSRSIETQRTSSQHRRRDGSTIDVDVVMQSIRFGGHAAWLVVVNDTTERNRLAARVMLADRMASIGILAAGVAHEINNPLSYVIANIGFVLDALSPLGDEVPPTADELRGALGEAQDGARRIRAIVRELKMLSRPEERQLGAVDVHTSLNTASNMAWNEIRHRARLVKDYGRDIPLVQGHEGRLGQVFLNLLVNAAQAIPEGAADTHEIRLTTIRNADGTVSVSVKDTGEGVEPEVQKRLFDPFFTTKPGGGTGLGLSICQSIITSLGGRIEVESERGKGTLFRITLPVAAAPVVPKPVRAPSHPPLRRARVLVIDDEVLIATAVKRTLQQAHDVTITSSGKEAVEWIRSGQRFDVIFCDLMMPVMSGMNVFAEISALAPDQAERIVFISGGAFTAAAQTFLDESTNERLEKPLDMHAVRSVVSRFLLRSQ